MTDLEQKYHKYKTKYLSNKQSGGCFGFGVGSSESLQTEGTEHTLNYKIYLGYNRDGKFIRVSPFHGVNIYPDFNKLNIVNMIVEIPQGTEEKMEINKEEPLNPIMYDIKDDKVRKVTYHAKGSAKSGYPFHYGAIPQTWEDNGHKDSRTEAYGDNDPIDAFDISGITAHSGQIKRVKILGAFAMIDSGETDWKLVCIDINDPKAFQYNDIKDVPKCILDTIEVFLRCYKTKNQNQCDPPNSFAKQMIWNASDSISIVQEVHEFWRNLMMNKKEVAKNSQNRDKVAENNVLNIQIVAEQ